MLLLGHGKVLTFDQKSRVINDGAVLIEDETIKAIGDTNELKNNYPEAEFKDVNGKVIMPGMINTHMHLYSTFARGMDLKTEQPARNFVEILEKLWWRLDGKMNEDDIYYSAIYPLLIGIRQGTTSIIDHHASYGMTEGSLSVIAEAVKEAGIRADLSYEISDRHGRKEADLAIEENERYIKNLSHYDQKYFAGKIGLHASFTLGDETLQKVSALADQLDVGFHIHVAEGRADVEHSHLQGYHGVVERLANYNIWRPGTIAIHGVHLQEGELEILKENSCSLIHNPESNMSNAVGLSPVKEAFAKGLNVGLGTDGYTTDMFESIKVAHLLIKHGNQDPRPGWEEIPAMAFANNRKIASQSFGVDLGVLKEGAAADIIVVDYDAPTEILPENVYAHLLFGINGGMVETTIVGGNVLMENQEVKILDDERIYQEVREQATDFWRRF